MLPRFFCESLSSQPEQVYLEKEEAHHLLKVKRIKIGEKVVLFDGQGKYCEVQLLEIKQKQPLLQKIQPLQEESILLQNIHLAVAPPKGDLWNFLLQKVTELGVRQITPLICERSVVIKREKKPKWTQITIEACKQCGINYLPEIHPPTFFSSFLEQVNAEHSILMATSKKAPLLKEQAPLLKKSVILLIGPEGGFTEQEILHAEKHQTLQFHEPGSILRVETASIAFLAILRHLLQ